MLRKHGHEVACAAFWGLHGVPISWEGFPVFPGSGEDPFARDVLPVWYRYFGADLCITLLDVFALDPAQLQGMNLAHWMPVDCDRLSSMDASILSQSPGRPVAMSEHGVRVLKAAGRSPLYAPHMLDMDAWSPLEDRDEGRAKLGWNGRFVIGINAANQDPQRKGFSEQIAAFARFSARHDDAMMVIHSRAVTQHGQNLHSVIAHYGMQEKVLLTPQDTLAAGLIPEQGMISFHGAIDLCSNAAYGEGFGLSVLQSQACGIPVVVNDCSAMTELCGAGWKVTGQDFWNRGHNANWRVPFISSIDAAYEKAYARRGDEAMRRKARRFALAYDAEKVYERYWKPVLAELDPRRPVTLTTAPRVFSPVMFRDETDMLAMRLAETDGLIDQHVIVEAPTTHRMVPKPLGYAKAGKRLARYAPRITHVVTELPGDEDPWVNEHAQRDAAWPVIDAQAADRDWVIISDVDEIPSAALLERLRNGRVPGDVFAVRTAVYIHHARYRVPDDKVPPQFVVATAGHIRQHGGSLGAVRDGRLTYPVVGDGGWHFSWFGGPEAARVKLETATCHTELLTNGEGDLIADGTRYYTTEDGGGLPVTEVEIDESLPAWFRDGRAPAAWLGPAAYAEVTVPA